MPSVPLTELPLSAASLARIARLERAIPLCKAPILARVTGSASIADGEPRKIPMPYSPPRYKMTKNGPKEETWLLVIESKVATVTLPAGSYTLTATNRSENIRDSRQKTSRPLATVAAELRRVAQDDAEKVVAAFTAALTAWAKERAAKRRDRTPAKVAASPEDIERMKAARIAWAAEDAATADRRRARKLARASLTE